LILSPVLRQATEPARGRENSHTRPPLDADHFSLYGYPLDGPELDEAIRLKEATVAASASTLRKMAAFFLHVAELQEEHRSAFGHEHFCDFAQAPARLQQLADIIVTAPPPFAPKTPEEIP
jgi:hypothetical protein